VEANLGSNLARVGQEVGAPHQGLAGAKQGMCEVCRARHGLGHAVERYCIRRAVLILHRLIRRRWSRDTGIQPEGEAGAAGGDRSEVFGVIRTAIGIVSLPAGKCSGRARLD